MALTWSPSLTLTLSLSLTLTRLSSSSELLNQLGILWSNRARPLRALCFFHACETLCVTQYETLALATSDNGDNDELLAALRDVRAHTNFYLAQVFGALNLPGASAQFCLATLELQLRALLSAVDADDDDDGNSESAAGDHLVDVQDWIKNCLRLVDYYVAADNWSDAAVGLAACERLLARDVERGADASDVETIHVQRAETQLNWAKLHHAALRAAQLRDEGFLTAAAQPASPTAMRMARTLAADKNASDDSTKDDTTLSLGMRHVPAAAITSFDAARDVFKMGMRACDCAKHVFVLDGFVTQHVRVLQLESALYKRLVHFERDRKRQVAMQLRRLAILTPLLTAELNAAAYTALLQEVNYECAEIAADVFDLKQDKTPSDREGECDDKANAYALKAVHWYQQYVLLFYPPRSHNSTDQQPPQVVKTGAAVRLPSTAMSAHEFRSVLLGYFGLARVCGRLQFGKAHKDKTVLFWKQSLAYHEAVLELVRQFEHAQAASAGAGAGAGQGPNEAAALHELFDAELTISTEMVELLPEKINQLVYNNKLL